MIKKLYSQLHAGCIFIFIAERQTVPSISPIFFSTISENNRTIYGHSQNPFAHFATTKFNISSADISWMFKFAPSLERLETLENVEQIVNALELHGCKQHQIAKIMRRRPKVMTVNAERVVEPKLQLLKTWGIEGENLAKILTSKPQILDASLQRDLLPKMTLLKNIFQPQDSLIKALVRSPSILTYNLKKTLKPSLAFWEGYGFRGEELASFLLANPSLLQCTSLTPAKVDLIQKIGIDKGNKMYKHVLSVVATFNIETLEAKLHNLNMCGLMAEETWELFRVSPYIFHLSEEKVRENVNFIVDIMKLPANSVVKHPQLLQVDLDYVLKPRFLVLQKMKSMDVLGNLHLKLLCSIFRMPEAKFVSKIVKGRPESTILNEIYEKAIANDSSGTNILSNDS